MPDDDLKLRSLLGRTKDLILEHGPRTDPVRQHILGNEDVPEFKSMALTLILVAEHVLADRADREPFGMNECGSCIGCLAALNAGIFPRDSGFCWT